MTNRNIVTNAGWEQEWKEQRAIFDDDVEPVRDVFEQRARQAWINRYAQRFFDLQKNNPAAALEER